ncbi:unnamed protein product [Brassicogethes aeneus]|uniref:C2H2-type domain-containing protein n=1 Tax=Brassicogethes aeneus TaxID=1431903 RepID=A0A9P0AV93_BRAAE|nr:unnamed protein product [Brassicogethes aeneus]
MNGEEPKEIEMISISDICRLCANQSEKLIGIYTEDGCSNDLANKMNLYLPIKISETDDLPLQCCWQCASTLLAWHDLVVTTADTDRKLRSCQLVTEKQLLENIYQDTVISEEPSTEVVPEPDNSLTYYQTEKITEEDADNSPEKQLKLSDKSFDSSSIDSFVLKNAELLDDEGSNSNDFDSNLIAIDKKEIVGLNNEENTAVYEYSCQVCSVAYLTETEILNHVKECHGKDETAETTKEQIKIQMREKRTHNKIDQELVNDAKVIVDGKVYYNCKECGKSLHSPYTYVWHMRIHSGERPYVCDLCGKQFRVSQGLVRHLKETHAKIKNFPCDLCGRMFATKRNVEEHRRIHTNERPYICDLCGKAFKQKASLFVHNRSHNDTFPYKCSYCNQGFRSKPPLLIHVTRHTGEKPYACQVCGRCFRIKYELKRHTLIHSDYKPFTCGVCGMSFRQKRYLRNHNKANHPQLAAEEDTLKIKTD